MCKSIYILKVYSIHYTLRLNTNVSFGQNRRYKKSLFFLLQAPTHHSFTFNLRFLYELKHKVPLSKTVLGFSISDSLSFLLRRLKGKKHPTLALTKSRIWTCGWLVYRTNSLYQVLKLKQNFQKNKVVTSKS